MKTTRVIPRLSALLMLVALVWAGAATALAADAKSGRDIFLALTKANDEHVRSSLDGTGRGGGFGGGRGTGAQFMVFAAAYANKDSALYHDAKLIPAMEQFTKTLQDTQFEDGLWGEAGNIDSPPDSAFTLKTIAKGQLFLIQDNSAATTALRAHMKDVILKCAEGVRTGGIHTPNHRWAVSTALTHVNLIYPDKKLLDRVEDWLGEGQDVDAEGQWAERSPNYTSDVNNPANLDMAILLKKPALFEGLRRNLEMTIYHVDADGEVEIVASRRQDQRNSRKYISDYYVPYRYLAIHDKNPRFAGMARRIEKDFLEEIGRSSTNMSSALTCMMEYPELAGDLPAEEAPPENYAKVFPLTAMARVRHGETSATIYGGSDIYMGLGTGSGIATNPTFFRLHKGEAVLEGIRMTPSYFGTGFFYSQGLKAEGGKYVLSQKLDVPYHLPLPKEYRNAKGDYKLSPDMGNDGILGRYFSKLDFAHRPVQVRTLKTEVAVTEKDGTYELAFDVQQVDKVPVAVTIELAFRRGGKFDGVTAAGGGGGEGRGAGGAEGRGGRAGRGGGGGGRGGAGATDELAGTYLLKEGYGTYTMGQGSITFGPGNYSRAPGRMESEMITWVGGSVRGEGDRVYITGVTPFKYKLTLK